MGRTSEEARRRKEDLQRPKRLPEIVHVREGVIVLGVGFHVDPGDLRRLAALAACEGHDHVHAWFEWYLAPSGIALEVDELIELVGRWLSFNEIETAAQILSFVFIELPWAWNDEQLPRTEDQFRRAVDVTLRMWADWPDHRRSPRTKDHVSRVRECVDLALQLKGREARRVARLLEAELFDYEEPIL
jgi:hypothetical protein